MLSNKLSRPNRIWDDSPNETFLKLFFYCSKPTSTLVRGDGHFFLQFVENFWTFLQISNISRKFCRKFWFFNVTVPSFWSSWCQQYQASICCHEKFRKLFYLKLSKAFLPRNKNPRRVETASNKFFKSKILLQI